jgi:hypothetical protein
VAQEPTRGEEECGTSEVGLETPMSSPSSSGRTTHLRSSSQEVFDCHEGLFAAKARSGELFFLRLSKYLTSL